MVPARRRGQVQGNSAKIQIKHLGNLERIHRQNLKFIDQTDVRGVWIWGAPGVGKSHFARQVLGAEGYYPKLNNKWWDGYQSQKVVIMEDVDKETVKFLHHHLKIWADRWGSLARPRGRGCPHSPMAGSNFQLQHHGHPQGPRGPPAQEAITRRFMRFEMLSRDEIKNWDTYETVTPEAVAAIFK